MAAPVRIVAEDGPADRNAFLDLPYRIYRGHPVWVPPLRMAEADVMDQAKNPFFQHAEVQHFLALRGDRVVGRIAACENRLHNEVHEDRIGFFGFFDVEADAEAASALIEMARDWCAARELSPMRGPVNYSMNDSCGVLIDGFDDPPFLLMPYNRPDYDALLQGAGLVPVKELVSYWISTRNTTPPRFLRVVDRRLSRSNITLRDIDVKHFDREVQILKDIYNRSWEKNWGFVPATEAEFEHAAKDLKMLVDPHISGVAERDGQPVAFSAFVRDLNRILKRGSGNGRLLPTLWAKLAFGIKRIRYARCVLLGIVPEARGNAINEAFFVRAMHGGLEHGYYGAEAGWVLADNDAMGKPILAAGGKITKRYRMYETRT